MALFGNPEHEISVGLHEKIGPCDEWQEQITIFTLVTGQVSNDHLSMHTLNMLTEMITKLTLLQPFLQTSKRRNYLCATDFDEQYFDFSCLNGKVPKPHSEWYTICGTPYENRAEYVQVTFLVFILLPYCNVLIYKIAD